MKILFLDIDGVLNCGATFDRMHRSDAIEETMVARINQVLDATGCKIVISSSWRILTPIEELRDILCSHGLHEGVIIDVTPRADRRDEEIMMWLQEHPEVDRFAIVDDDVSDIMRLKNHLVATSFETGTLSEHVVKLIKLLN